MSEESLLRPLYQFHEYTEALLALAEKGDWEAFEQESLKRQELLPVINDGQFLIAVAKAGLAEEMREQIAQTQALNDRLSTLAEQAKSDIADTLKDQQTKDKAVKAYRTDP